MFVIHIGLHKTATTSLQKDVYPNINEYEFIGRGCVNLRDQDELYLKISEFCFSSKEFDCSDLEAVRILISERLSNSDLLFSDEWLTADYSGFFSYQGARWQEKLDRLSQLLRGIEHKILVSLRDPVDGLFSQYCEFLTVGVDGFYSDFEDYAFNSNDARVYEYFHLHKLLNERFSNIGYFTFEDINNDPDLKKLSEALGVNKLPKLGHHNRKKKIDGAVEIEKQSELVKYILRIIPVPVKEIIKRMRLVVSLKEAIGSYLSDKRNIPYPNERLRQQLEIKFKASYEFLKELRGS